METEMSMISVLFLGGLQALTGPDHYIVLISFCLARGLRGMRALQVGFAWSIGHNFSTSLVIYGIALFFLKNILHASISNISAMLGKLVGFSLVLVGFYGLREIREERAELEKKKAKKEKGEKSKEGKKGIDSYYAVFLTGLIQGFSGLDSVIGLIPSLSASSLFSICTYISLLTIGTTIVMCLFCVLLGDLPLTLSTYACYLSIGIGAVMTLLEFSGII